MQSLTSLLETIKSAQVFKLELTGTCRPGYELLEPESRLKCCLCGICIRGTAAQLSPWMHLGKCRAWHWALPSWPLPTNQPQYFQIWSLLHSLGICPELQVHFNQVRMPIQVPGPELTSDWHTGYEFSLLTTWGHVEAVCGVEYLICAYNI